MESYMVETIRDKDGKFNVKAYNDMNINEALAYICYDFDDENSTFMPEDLIEISVSSKLNFIKNYCSTIRDIYVVTRENLMNDEREYVFYRH